MHYTELFTQEALDKALAEKLVKVEKHPTLPLYIYNYTANAQFAWHWDDVTLNCRGLILDGEGNVVARPFKKFFSYEQLDGKLPEGNFVVEEKMDGSMLVVTKYKDNLVVATRGSFVSDQAKRGQKILDEKYSQRRFTDGATWIFEVIYPENRVVVDYKGMEDIVLLAVVMNDSGEDITHFFRLDSPSHKYDFYLSPKTYSFESLEDILAYEEPNLEGFVLRYESGERVKIKLEDYKRLHRLITGVSEKTVWEALKDGKFEELIENVPDEFYDWVHGVKANLDEKYEEVLYAALEDYRPLAHLKDDRKAFALEAQKTRYPAILFKALDGKDFYEHIWKIVKPEVTQVFKMVSENSS